MVHHAYEPCLPPPPFARAGGALEDLLPALDGKEQGNELLPSHLMPTTGSASGTAMPPTVPSALLAGPTSQYPLFAETGGATQLGAGLPKESINRATMTVLQVGGGSKQQWARRAACCWRGRRAGPGRRGGLLSDRAEAASLRPPPSGMVPGAWAPTVARGCRGWHPGLTWVLSARALQIFRQRLFRLQSQEQPDPQLSFFDLVRQLSRQEATKLFYQVPGRSQCLA
jgi:hypothetical protein